MSDDGYIKFNCDWDKSVPLSVKELKDLNVWRQELYELGLIGMYSDGIGFGNISVRVPHSNNFIITGSATGGYKELTPEHYTKVVDFDIDRNYLKCVGPIKASSESLSHAVIYTLDEHINAVIHIHNLNFWNRMMARNDIPITSSDVPYGTPEMAREIARVYLEKDFKNQKILAMGGHKEGIITMGKDLGEAGDIMLRFYKNLG